MLDKQETDDESLTTIILKRQEVYLYKLIYHGCENKFSALSDQQYTVLNRIEIDYFHEGAIQEAIDSITGSAINLAIFDDFRLSDGEIHSSADGQRFESKFGNPLVDHSAKHFGKKFGYQFAPRYARFQHRFLSEFKFNFDEGATSTLDRPINWRQSI